MSLTGVKHDGEIINNRQIDVFHLTEVLYPSDFSISRHFHHYACFSLVFQGAYKEVFRNKVIECSPSDVIFRPAEETHSDHFGNQNTGCLLIEFEPEWLMNLRQKSINLHEPAGFRSDSLTWLAMKLRREFQQSDDFTILTVEGLMLELVAEIGRSSLKPFEIKQPRWLRQVVEILHENFAGHLPLSQIADSAGVHPVYLAEVFRRHYKCTIGEYVRQLRIEFACREISKTDAPLAEIGLASGFSHQAHFSRTFKRLTGLTPAQFRAISRRKP